MGRTFAVGVTFIVGLCAVPLLGQTQDQKPRAFEVASVKPNTSGQAEGSQMFEPGGRFRATNVPVYNLIANAFGVSRRPLANFELIGAPDWIKSERFDVAIKTIDGARQDPTGLRAGLRSMLVDRFKLQTHWEMRQMPLYALNQVRKDAGLGPQLRHSDCNGFDGIDHGPGRMRAGCVTMTHLADALADEVGRPVTNFTALTGNFDAELQWTPDQDATSSPAEPNAPSIFTAVSEQLGLKVTAGRGPVQVLVIDHVERPTPD